MKKSTLIKLGIVTALVLIPRRSSRKAGCGCLSKKGGCGCSAKKATDEKVANEKTENQSCDSKKGCDRKSCKCPLCRIGKCPLCAIGKCFCCKKSADKAEKSEKKGCCGNDKKAEK